MPRAQKDHICTLCLAPIYTGEWYIYTTITPWDHANNETFSTFKAHKKCNALWVNGIGESVDWVFPADKYEWLEWLNET